MGIISGQDAKFQIGIGGTWGDSAAPQYTLAFTSEDLKLEPGYITEDAMVGKKTDGRMDISSKKITGGWNQIVHADDIGLAIAATMGGGDTASSAGDTTPGGDSLFIHTFTPLAGGTSSSLPAIGCVVDRKIDTFGYDSCKINGFSFDNSARDYLRARFDVIGYDENDGDTIDATLAASTLEAFSFDDVTVSIGTDGAEVEQVDVTNISISYTNNLEDDKFTTGSDTNMAEIEPQKREITVSLDAFYTTLTNTVRSSYFKVGTAASCVITWTDSVEGYILSFDMPLCYVTDASPVIGGPETLTQTIELKATESSSLEALTVYLTNIKETDYLS